MRHELINPSAEFIATRQEFPSREAFAPLAEKYRKQQMQRFFAALAYVFLGSPLLFHFLPDKLASVVGFAGAVLLLARLHPKMPDFPVCGQAVDALWGSHCPDCGGELRRAQPNQPPNCDNCGKKLRVGKSRNFKYRACTHCGAQLDAQGL